MMSREIEAKHKTINSHHDGDFGTAGRSIAKLILNAPKPMNKILGFSRFASMLLSNKCRLL